jgi:hypothetical protein
MPEPLHGLVAIAEYGSKVEVDLAVGALADVGITATASFDPAMNTAAPFMASDRTFELLVRDADAEAAVARLHDVVDGLPEEFSIALPAPRTSRRRTRLRRIVLVGLVLWFAVPALVFAIAMIVNG